MLLIRHGQSTANASGVWQGQLDFPLSSEGRRQATLTGKALAGEHIAGIYASPLIRAFETAEIIAGEAGFPDKVVPDDGFKERSGGVLEGYTWAEQEARNPELVEKFSSLPEEEAWTIVGAETDEQVLARFEVAISEICTSRNEGGNLIVVSHGGAIRAFLRDRFGPKILAGDERAPNASITRVALKNDGSPSALLELAATSHLELI